jgi:hypothetical protein
MAGETEAVRKLGIDLSDTGLNQFNKTVLGDARKMQQLTLAEKSFIRFRKIMYDTTDAVGDAARSSDRWAGVLKKLTGRVKTLMVEWGRKLMPLLLAGLNGVNEGLGKMDEYLTWATEKTSTLQTVAVMAFGSWALHIWKAVGGMKALVTAFQALQVAAPWLLVISGAFLAIEDVVTFLRGGKSIMGNILSDLLGVKKPLILIQNEFKHLRSLIWDVIKAIGFLPVALFEVAAAIKKGDLQGAKDWYSKYTEGMFGQDKRRNEEVSQWNAQANAAVQTGDAKAFVEAETNKGRSKAQMKADYEIRRAAHLRDHPETYNETDARIGIVPLGGDLQTKNVAPSIVSSVPEITGRVPVTMSGDSGAGSAATSTTTKTTTITLGPVSISTQADPAQVEEALQSVIRQSVAADEEGGN